MPSVQKKDSGNFTCSPSNSADATIVLNVINGRCKQIKLLCIGEEFDASHVLRSIQSKLLQVQQPENK